MARRSDHTREELTGLAVQTAWKIVGSEGHEGLTARRLAREIGYAPGTIYNLFSSMEELDLHVNAITLRQLYEVLASPACHKKDKSPTENMKKMAALYRDFARKNRNHWLMLFTRGLSDERVAPNWYQTEVARLFSPLEELLRPLYGDDTEKTRMAARSLWASVHGLCFLQETGRLPLSGDESAAGDMTGYLIESFIRGVEQEQAN